MSARKCYTCLQVKELKLFKRNKNQSLGYSYLCVVCARIQGAERYRLKRRCPLFRADALKRSKDWQRRNAERYSKDQQRRRDAQFGKFGEAHRVFLQLTRKPRKKDSNESI